MGLDRAGELVRVVPGPALALLARAQVGVRVDEPGQHPAAGRVDDGTPGGGLRSGPPTAAILPSMITTVPPPIGSPSMGTTRPPVIAMLRAPPSLAIRHATALSLDNSLVSFHPGGPAGLSARR